jgi:pimeloyl-ACP methyl ester carboxylesterase
MKKRYLLAGISGVVAGAVATKLLTRPADVSWPDSIDLIYHPEYSWFTRIAGMRIHYQEAGDEKAPALVLIHGLISSTLVWSEVFLPLADSGFRVIAIDLPGYGYSDKPADGRYTIDSQAHAVVSLMDRLGIDSAAIVGVSYGGAIAATIALDYPERVKRLVLVGAVSSDEPKKKLLLRILQIPIVGDIVTPLFLGSRWVLRRRMEEAYRRIGKRLDEHMVSARHHVLETANMQRAMIRTVRRWNANRIQRQAPLIRASTLLVWGEADSHVPLSEGFRLRDAIPGARLIVIRNCGHLPPAESPDTFVKVVRDFCQAEHAESDAMTPPLEFKRRKKSEPPAVAGG